METFLNMLWNYKYIPISCDSEPLLYRGSMNMCIVTLDAKKHHSMKGNSNDVQWEHHSKTQLHTRMVCTIGRRAGSLQSFWQDCLLQNISGNSCSLMMISSSLRIKLLVWHGWCLWQAFIQRNGIAGLTLYKWRELHSDGLILRLLNR